MPKIKKKIGILGGGQLARMMVLKAHELGLEPHVLSSNSDDPSAQVTSFWTKGNLNSTTSLVQFLKKTDVVTFENEFVNTSALQQAMKRSKTPVRPHPQIIDTLQDRLSQKKLLKKHNIPTSTFYSVSSYKEALTALNQLNNKMVLKQRRLGYDGYGTFVVKNISDLKKIKSKLKKGFIAEEFIPFQKELALLFASQYKKKIVHLPLVETFQKNFRCYWVKGPVTHSQIKNLIIRIKKFLKAIKYDGVIAFELFQTQKGLLVNEVAPRVHNSGHYSLNVLSKDQFSLHIEAILNRPLITPKILYKGFAMLNLIGQVEKSTDWQKINDVFLHDYRKKELRSTRKMGHLNAGGASGNDALKKLFKAQKFFSTKLK